MTSASNFFVTTVPLGLSVLAVVLLLLSFWLAWPWTINAWRQMRIRRSLKRLEDKGAQILSNLILPDRKGGSVWIDYLIVTSHGITAVQLLSLAGRVYGSPYDATWVQEYGHSRFRFPNPLRQGNQAAEVIRNILGNFEVHEALVYSGCELHESMPAHVVRAEEMEAFLLREEGRKLSSARRSWILNTLRQLAIDDAELVRQHEREAIERQGPMHHLAWARNLMLVSCVCIIAAIGIVAAHLLDMREG